MGWRDLKHWQKGGVVGGIIGIFVPFLFYKFELILTHETSIIIVFIESLLVSPIAISWEFVFHYLKKFAFFGIKSEEGLFLLMSLFSFIPYFILGSALGQIYCEIKNPVSLRDKSRIFSRLLALSILIVYLIVTFFTFLIFISGEIS